MGCAFSPEYYPRNNYRKDRKNAFKADEDQIVMPDLKLFQELFTRLFQNMINYQKSSVKKPPGYKSIIRAVPESR